MGQPEPDNIQAWGRSSGPTASRHWAIHTALHLIASARRSVAGQTIHGEDGVSTPHPTCGGS